MRLLKNRHGPVEMALSLGLGLLAAGVFSCLSAADQATPGAVNYVEGQLSIEGRHLNSQSVGSEVLGRNQALTTGRGKAEILLTPGVFLRVGDNSSILMISPGLTDTQVELQQGEASLEVDELHKENSIRVLVDGSATQIRQRGLYEFNARNQTVAVYDGKADVTKDGQTVTLKKGRETSLAAVLKASRFDRKAEDSLFAWSQLRSKYVSEASNEYANSVVAEGWPWWGPGWYWNSYWGLYGYVPGFGVAYSPFGWGYYSPLVIGPRWGWRGGASFPHSVPAGHFGWRGGFHR